MRSALVLLLVTPALSGCLGGSDEDTEPLRRARVEFTEGTGGVGGLVTDLAVQPIGGATVTVVELGLAGTSQADGSYAISNVPPGAYTVEATVSGFVPATFPVAVVAGEVATVDFVLTPVTSTAAFTELFELNGFVECGQQVGWELRPFVGPYTKQVDDAVNNTTGTNPDLSNQYGLTWFFLGIATCAVPNVVQENTTNDRFIHFFQLQPPVETMMYRMEWDDRGNQMNGWFSGLIELEGYSNNDAATFVEIDSASPIVARVDRDRFENVSEYLRSDCENNTGSQSCGINPWDQGWPMQSRVFAAWQCLSESGGACSAVQQDFRIFVETFYNAPAPEGYELGTTTPTRR